jgi:hypothetical protein
MALVSIFDGIARSRAQLITHDVEFDELGQRWESIYLSRRGNDSRGHMYGAKVVGGNVEPLSSSAPSVDESAQPPTAFREVRKQRHKRHRPETKHPKYERRQSLTEMAYRLTGKRKRGQD